MIGDGRPLRVYWSKREKDWMIDSPSRSSGHLMSDILAKINDELADLYERGYDLTTLRLTVKQQEPPK